MPHVSFIGVAASPLGPPIRPRPSLHRLPLWHSLSRSQPSRRSVPGLPTSAAALRVPILTSLRPRVTAALPGPPLRPQPALHRPPLRHWPTRSRPSQLCSLPSVLAPRFSPTYPACVMRPLPPWRRRCPTSHGRSVPGFADPLCPLHWRRCYSHTAPPPPTTAPPTRMRSRSPWIRRAATIMANGDRLLRPGVHPCAMPQQHPALYP
ncbi:hypothetical protein PVAP13_9KG143300 [Panicum virgatum]|uniref:Uncharacterized protein n=1 Tax=Panicum virgatum TaxID=38727 RepID=A0A8T0ND92_PANVG|nr:hypothetical protein PVAP13_9KG143300 [Panicum virgatum]